MLLAEETEARRAGDGGGVIGGGAGVGWGAVAGDGGRVMGASREEAGRWPCPRQPAVCHRTALPPGGRS